MVFTVEQESRVLKFWFSPETEYFDRVTCAYEFFKELVRPENFPRGNCPASSCLYCLIYVVAISTIHLSCFSYLSSLLS